MLNQSCHIVTHMPDSRTGPMMLRSAVRLIVEHRPDALSVELHLEKGPILCEEEADALYALASLSLADGVRVFSD